MLRRDRRKWNGKVVSVEVLHELASDQRIAEINLGDSIKGTYIKGCTETDKEYERWELQYKDGKRIFVYV